MVIAGSDEASDADYLQIVEQARKVQPEWASIPPEGRARILREVHVRGRVLPLLRDRGRELGHETRAASMADAHLLARSRHRDVNVVVDDVVLGETVEDDRRDGEILPLETLAVLGHVDGVGRRPQDRDAGGGEARRQLQRRLAAQLHHHAVGALEPHDLEHVFQRLGVTWEVEGDDLVVPAEQKLTIVPDLDGAIPEIKTNVWPAFPTDLISIAITVATQASGSVLFHDWMFSGRMYFTDKLVGMGAKIILCDPYRCLIQGPNRLYGENLESPDIRAGMSMLRAALAAKGQSTIRNIGQIERGYQDVDKKLRALGAHIERMKE